MGIRGEAFRPVTQLAAEVMQRLFRQAAFDVPARVDAGRRMALEIDLVAALRGIFAAQKVVEGDFIEGGRRGKDLLWPVRHLSG